MVRPRERAQEVTQRWGDWNHVPFDLVLEKRKDRMAQIIGTITQAAGRFLLSLILLAGCAGCLASRSSAPRSGVSTSQGQGLPSGAKVLDARTAVCLQNVQSMGVLQVFVKDAVGQWQIAHTVDDSNVNVANSVDSIERLDRNRVFVILHVNPSLGVGVEIELQKKWHRVFTGYTFVWNDSRNSVAYLAGPPHFLRSEEMWTELWIDGKCIRRFEASDGIRVVWKNASAVLVSFRDGDTPAEVQLVGENR